MNRSGAVISYRTFKACEELVSDAIKSEMVERLGDGMPSADRRAVFSQPQDAIKKKRGGGRS